MARREADSCRPRRSALGGAVSPGTQRGPRPDISPFRVSQSPKWSRSSRKRTLKGYSERPLWKLMMEENAGSHGEPTFPPASAWSLPREPSPASRLRPPGSLLEELSGRVKKGGREDRRGHFSQSHQLLHQVHPAS